MSQIYVIENKLFAISSMQLHGCGSQRVQKIELGCDVCNGDAALLDREDMRIFLSSDGKLEVFVSGKDEPIAAVQLMHCPECGRIFQVQ